MDRILKLDICIEAREWLIANQHKSLYQLWRTCKHGEWLLWLADQLDIDHLLVVQAACDCAERLLVYAPKCEKRPRIAIETVRSWCRGEATMGELHFAGRAAYSAYNIQTDCNAAQAAYAAYAAAHDAYVAIEYVASTGMCDTARLVRRRIPWPLWKNKLEDLWDS